MLNVFILLKLESTWSIESIPHKQSNMPYPGTIVREAQWVFPSHDDIVNGTLAQSQKPYILFANFFIVREFKIFCPLV